MNDRQLPERDLGIVKGAFVGVFRMVAANAKAGLERFSSVMNREGFPRAGFSDSESMLVKEAGMDGSSLIDGFACAASGCG